MNAAIENNFRHHPPTEAQVKRYEELRLEAKALAIAIDKLCPASREKSLAMTNLEQAVMWANAAIARSGATSAARNDK